MTVKEAREYANGFESRATNTEEEEFLYIEAMRFLIEEEKDPRDMMWLGGYYYEQRHFDLALKYYEMARSYDYDEAYECLGYIWYYGRTGEKDYKKAYEYFSRLMDTGNPVATYKVADMYKNGYYVEKDYQRYVEIIEDLYDNKVTTFRSLGDPFPEISVRLAEIRRKQGNIEAAVELLIIAKDFLARRISCNPFFGNLNIMRGLIDDLYEMVEFDYEYFDFFDLYHLLKEACLIKFDYEDAQYMIETREEDGMCAIHFDGKWYRDRDEFFAKAKVGDKLATEIYDKFYGWGCKSNLASLRA
ncbi:MAG: hypothetical protein K6B44_04990 [Lachnospiraceae bacterium]|nr:hypothetical protein [Lachnospiraceae bacterium]